jgi:thioredoxin 2
MIAQHDHMICKSCGTTNRVPQARDGGTLRCGRCRRPLLLGESNNGKPIEVDDRSFEKEVIKSQIPVLVDCWAPWCGPCRIVAPTIDQLARKYSGRVKVTKLNTDDNPEVTASYGILSIPTLLIFRGGKLVDRMVGTIPRAEIERRLSRV